MNPAIIGSIISGLFGLGSSALQGDPYQKRQSFANTNVDPRLMLSNVMGNVNELGGALGDKMRSGFKLRTVAQSPKGFAQDPAAVDPSLLQYGGLDLGTLFGRLGNQRSPRPTPPAGPDDQLGPPRSRRQ